MLLFFLSVHPHLSQLFHTCSSLLHPHLTTTSLNVVGKTKAFLKFMSIFESITNVLPFSPIVPLYLPPSLHHLLSVSTSYASMNLSSLIKFSKVPPSSYKPLHRFPFSPFFLVFLGRSAPPPIKAKPHKAFLNHPRTENAGKTGNNFPPPYL